MTITFRIQYALPDNTIDVEDVEVVGCLQYNMVRMAMDAFESEHTGVTPIEIHEVERH